MPTRIIMTSPNLKRSLDHDLQPQLAGSEETLSPSQSGPPSSNGGQANPSSSSHSNASSNKRRCTNYKSESHFASSPFRDSASINFRTSNLDDLASRIRDEINYQHKLSSEPDQSKSPQSSSDNGTTSDEGPVLTLRQAQLICEKIIREREQKLREEYDRVLACKIAQQYELASKVNYAYGQESRLSNPSLATNSTTPSPTVNALAAAITSMQRSAAVAAVANQAAASASSLPDLTSLAALSADPLHHHHHHHQPGPLGGSHIAYNMHHHHHPAAIALQQAHHQRAAAVAAAARGEVLLNGPVLLASNLDEKQLATPEALFTLFGVFGDVIRVKILFNRKDSALIQMADSSQAQVAQGYLDKQRIFGKVIRVTRSKHHTVQLPRDNNQSDAGLTKDFSNSPLHRFKIPGSRNYLNIYPPSNTLHISNIPVNIDEADLHRAFKEACGFEFSSLKFFPKDRKMALVKYGSVEGATIALIKMHNYAISEENKLRVSFSKSVMQP